MPPPPAPYDDHLRHGRDVRSRDQRRLPVVPHGDEDREWGPSDLRHIIRQLHDHRPNVARGALRRLHLKWFHASIDTMRRLLSLMGIPSDVMAMIPAIVDTCRICRQWARNAPAVRTALRIALRFNQAVQGDLLFYSDETGTVVKDYIILHLICECIRFTVAEEIPDKVTATILQCITARWIRVHGPPELLTFDGEGALNSDEAKVWADRWNIKLNIKPKDNKAWIVERHHEILRAQLHKTQSQLQVENIKCTFSDILSEAVLAKNSLLSTGQGTPYQSLYGRLPHWLPQIEDIVGDARMQDETGIDGLRHVHRLREVSVGSAVTAMADHRLKLANKSKTPLAGEQLELSTGDQVEIYRKSSQKDRPGWVGPATVTDLTDIQHGKVTVKWQGRHITVGIESLRRAMTYFIKFLDVYAYRLHHPEKLTSWEVITQYVHSMNKRAVTVGWVHTTTGWRLSSRGHQERPITERHT